MIIKSYRKQTALLIAVFALFGLMTLLPATASAQTTDIGAGGSTSIIGLPSRGSRFQNATSQAQSGAYNSPVGGASLLQENKSALIIVDSPATRTSSVVPEISSANYWWVMVLIFVALISFAGIILVILAQKYGQTDSSLVETEEEPLAEEPELEPKVETEAEIEPATETVEPDNKAEANEIIENTQESLEQSGIQVVDFEETQAEKQDKQGKKISHSGRPIKKSRQ